MTGLAKVSRNGSTSLPARGAGLVRSRSGTIGLLGLLVVGNLVALAILVAGLVTSSASDLSGGQLLLTGFAIHTSGVIVFGLLYSGSSMAVVRSRLRHAPARVPVDFRFPQDDRPQRWRPVAWDYLYVSLTNSIAFSPTDTMPLSLRAKASMALESAISAVTDIICRGTRRKRARHLTPAAAAPECDR